MLHRAHALRLTEGSDQEGGLQNVTEQLVNKQASRSELLF